MARYTGTIASPKPVGEAFAYLADFSSVAEWDPSVVRARMLGERPGPGTEFEVVVRFAGRELQFIYRTTAFEPERRIVLRAESPTVVSEDTISFRETASGCEVTYDADLAPKGAMRLANPVLGLMFKRLGGDAADGLRRELGA